MWPLRQPNGDATRQPSLGAQPMGGSVFITPYDQKTGRALCERAREAGCGPGEVPLSATAQLTLRETLEWARCVPRSARVAQGVPRIADFARKVKRLRGERAELRRQHPDPLRRAILDKLDRVLADRSDLIIAARREARFWWKPRVHVWWGGGKPRANYCVTTS